MLILLLHARNSETSVRKWRVRGTVASRSFSRVPSWMARVPLPATWTERYRFAISYLSGTAIKRNERTHDTPAAHSILLRSRSRRRFHNSGHAYLEARYYTRRIDYCLSDYFPNVGLVANRHCRWHELLPLNSRPPHNATRESEDKENAFAESVRVR